MRALPIIWKRTRFMVPWLLLPLLVLLLLQSWSTSCARACRNGCITPPSVRTEREGRAAESATVKAVVAKTILPDSASNALWASGLAFAGCQRPGDEIGHLETMHA